MIAEKGFTQSMTQEVYKTLYFNYLHELNAYKTEMFTEQDIEKSYNISVEEIEQGSCILYPIGNIGFILIGIENNKHPDFDFYIQEAYIKPEFRRNGLMSNLFRQILEENKGTGTLYILNMNETGIKFWKTLGRLVQLNDEYDNCPDGTQYILTRTR